MTNQKEFINEFIIYLKSNIADFNEHFKELRRREKETIVDDTAIYRR